MSSRFAASLAGVAVLAAGCVGAPPIIGFPHPNPAPNSGHEIGLLQGLGTASTAVFGTVGLSYAGRVGNGGIGLTGWGGYGMFGPVSGLNLEGAIPIGGERATGATYVLVGGGAGATGLTAGAGSVRVQLATGLLWAPPSRRAGWFGGLRLGGGVFLSPLRLSSIDYGGTAIHVGAGAGYRWRLDATTAIDLQLHPFVEAYVRQDGGTCLVGALLLLGFAFDVG
jgi:hypothetical protein